MISRTSCARKRKKFSTNSGLPANFFRSSGSCVAMPTGHVFRWQTRIITQPMTTSGAVAKPNSSAPRSAAMTTSRPVFIWPSTWTTMRSRSLLSTRTCWVSASPSSHGTPPCLMDVNGEAPVPPSWPEISTTSAWAFDTPAATVPTPTSATSLTWIRAALAGVGLAAHPVHGDGQRLVRLLADGAVGHGAGGEPLENRLDRLHLVERQRLPGLHLDEAAQGRELAALVVHQLRVLAEDPGLARARGVLQLEHRVGVEQVVLAVAPPLVLAAPVEVGVTD